MIYLPLLGWLWSSVRCFLPGGFMKFNPSLLQVKSRASVWCAPCRTTSFRFLPTQATSLNPLVSSMSSKVRTSAKLSLYFAKRPMPFCYIVFTCWVFTLFFCKKSSTVISLLMHSIFFVALSCQGIAKHFRYGSQEDAHEFLRYTVDAMQKSCLPGTKWVISTLLFVSLQHSFY